MIKKLFTSLMVAVMLCLVPVIISSDSTYYIETVHAEEDFASNESYYYELCSKSGLTTEQKNTCKLFQQYLNDKVSEINKKVNENQKEINATICRLNTLVTRISNARTGMLYASVMTDEPVSVSININLK